MKSEDNEADIFTKNTTNVISQHHQKKFVWDKGNVDNEVNKELTQNESQQEGLTGTAQSHFQRLLAWLL